MKCAAAAISHCVLFVACIRRIHFPCQFLTYFLSIFCIFLLAPIAMVEKRSSTSNFQTVFSTVFTMSGHLHRVRQREKEE